MRNRGNIFNNRWADFRFFCLHLRRSDLRFTTILFKIISFNLRLRRSILGTQRYIQANEIEVEINIRWAGGLCLIYFQYVFQCSLLFFYCFALIFCHGEARENIFNNHWVPKFLTIISVGYTHNTT